LQPNHSKSDRLLGAGNGPEAFIPVRSARAANPPRLG